MSYLEDIRNDIKVFGERLYGDPNAPDSRKEYYEYVKRVFSNVRILKEAGSREILAGMCLVYPGISDEDIIMKYKGLEKEINEKLVLQDSN